MKWTDKEINIKMLLNEIFQKYISGLGIEKFNDTRAFYKIAKAMIKPKGGIFVKGIKEGDIIHIDKDKVELIEKHFKNLYDDNINNHKKLKTITFLILNQR